jgi:hypothetical protein
MTALRVFCCSLLLTLCPAQLFAWGSIGHMTVDYAAYERLTPATKARVRDLLKLNPDFANWEKQIPAGTSVDDHDRMIFMMAATWADDIKGDSKYSDDGPDPNRPDGPTSSQNIGYTDLFRHRYWHFVDMPFSPDHTALPPIPTPNAQTQIDAFRAVLASAQSDDLKSYDLVWLLHLVGDIHQPLHATTRVTASNTSGDSGGNDVTLVGDASSNLHSYWDDLPGFDCNFCNKKINCVERATALGKTLTTPGATYIHNTKTAVWIQESFDAAKSTAYHAPMGAGDGPYTIAPSSLYETTAFRLAKRRIALAGARLAEVLNNELK